MALRVFYVTLVIDEREVIFVSIQIAEKTTEELRQMNLLGLLPLFILSKGGKQYEVLDEVITRLRKEEESELLALTRLFAVLVFVSGDEQAWLVRRFTMLQNIEDTPNYKRLVQKGHLLQMREIIEAIVRKRFPSLLKMVQAKVENMTDLDKLQEILIEMSTARLARDARRYLMELASEEPQA